MNTLRGETNKNIVDQTNPDIAFLQKKLGLEQQDKSSQMKINENKLDRELRQKMLEEQIKSRQQIASMNKKTKPHPLDGETAREYSKFMTADGPKAQTNISSLQSSIDMLSGKSPEVNTGGIRGMIAKLPGSSITSPGIDTIRQNVHSVIFETLRPILGSQFTQQEGERLLNLSFSETRDNAENARRIGKLLKLTKDVVDSKMDMMQYFEENDGSMSGYKGTAKIKKSLDAIKKLSNSESNNSQNGMPDFGKMSKEELKAYISTP